MWGSEVSSALDVAPERGSVESNPVTLLASGQLDRHLYCVEVLAHPSHPLTCTQHVKSGTWNAPGFDCCSCSCGGFFLFSPLVITEPVSVSGHFRGLREGSSILILWSSVFPRGLNPSSPISVQHNSRGWAVLCVVVAVLCELGMFVCPRFDGLTTSGWVVLCLQLETRNLTFQVYDLTFRYVYIITAVAVVIWYVWQIKKCEEKWFSQWIFEEL